MGEEINLAEIYAPKKKEPENISYSKIYSKSKESKPAVKEKIVDTSPEAGLPFTLYYPAKAIRRIKEVFFENKQQEEEKIDYSKIYRKKEQAPVEVKIPGITSFAPVMNEQEAKDRLLPPPGAHRPTLNEIISNATVFENRDLIDQAKQQQEKGIIETFAPAIGAAAAAPVALGLAELLAPALGGAAVRGASSIGRAVGAVSSQLTGKSATEVGYELIKGMTAASIAPIVTSNIVRGLEKTKLNRPLSNLLAEINFNTSLLTDLPPNLMRKVVFRDFDSPMFNRAVERQVQHQENLIKYGEKYSLDEEELNKKLLDNFIELGTFIFADKGLDFSASVGGRILKASEPIMQIAGLDAKKAFDGANKLRGISATPIQKSRMWFKNITTLTPEEKSVVRNFKEQFRKEAYGAVEETIKPVSDVLTKIDYPRRYVAKQYEKVLKTAKEKISENIGLEDWWGRAYDTYGMIGNTVREVSKNILANEKILPPYARALRNRAIKHGNMLEAEIDAVGNNLAQNLSKDELQNMYNYSAQFARKKEAVRIVQKQFKSELNMVGNPILEEDILEKIKNNSYEQNKALMKRMEIKRTRELESVERSYLVKKKRLLDKETVDVKELKKLEASYLRAKKSVLNEIDNTIKEVDRASKFYSEERKLEARISEIKKTRVEREAIPLGIIGKIEETPPVELLPHLKPIYDRASQTVLKWGEKLYKEGLLKSFNKEEQKNYVARFWEKYSTGNKKASEIFNYRDPDSIAMKKTWEEGLKHRRDMTQEEKDKLIEIEDYLNSFYIRGSQVAQATKIREIQNKLAQYGARKGDVILKDVGGISQEEMLLSLGKKAQSMELIPDLPKYGPLAGSYATRRIADMVRDPLAMAADTPKTWDTILSIFKKTKLFLDPVIYAFNYMGQTFNEMLHGYPLWRVDSRISGFNEYINKGPYYKTLRDKYNAFSKEESISAELQASLQKHLETPGDETAIPKILSFLNDNAVINKAEQAYRLVDDVQKTGYFKYLKEVEKLSDDAAYRKMKRIYVGPQDVPKGSAFKFVRRNLYPFLAFTATITPGLVKSIEHPERWLTASMAKNAWNEYARTKLDEQMKEEGRSLFEDSPVGLSRKDLNRFIKETRGVGNLFDILKPSLDKNGNLQFLSMRRGLPLGMALDVANVGETGLGGILPSDPRWQTIARIANAKLYRYKYGKLGEMQAVYPRMTETGSEEGMKEFTKRSINKTLVDLYKIWSPNLIGYGASKLWSAAELELPLPERLGNMVAKASKSLSGSGKYEEGKFIKEKVTDFYGRARDFNQAVLGTLTIFRITPYGTYTKNMLDAIETKHDEIEKLRQDPNSDPMEILRLMKSIPRDFGNIADYRTTRKWKIEREKLVEQLQQLTGASKEDAEMKIRMGDMLFDKNFKLGLNIGAQ